MIELASTYVPIIALAVVGIWGVATGLQARKSPPRTARFYGIYLRTSLIVGGLACLAAAVVLARKWILG